METQLSNMPTQKKIAPAPLSLFRTHEYTGYQLYVTVQYNGYGADACMRYCIAIVLDWLRKKIPDQVYPEQIITPSPDEALTIEDMKVESCRYSKGYSFNITSLLDEGIWSLNVHEPDSDRPDRPGVVGRTIVTDIALHKSDKEYVELGIKTTILDPISVEELPSSFRPAIVRTLLLNNEVYLNHVQTIRYCNVQRITTQDEMKSFLRDMEDPNQCLPAVVFTYERKSIKETIEAAEEEMNLNGKSGALQALIEKINSKNVFEEALPSLPYDVEEFAHKTYGYGWTYLISDEILDKVASMLPFQIQPGDVLFIEPKHLSPRIYEGIPQRYPYSEYRTKEDRNALYNKLKNQVLVFSKEKDVNYHGVIFERKARDRENEIRIAEAIAKGGSDMETSLGELFDRMNRDIQGFKTSISDYKIENKNLNEEINNLNVKIVNMQRSYDQAKGIQNSVDQMRSIDQMPESNLDVVNYYKNVFPDRIDFTKSGIRSAEESKIKPSTLWSVLHTIVYHLVDIYRSDSISDVESAFQEKTGLILALHESPTTHQNGRLEKLRNVEYNGRTISIKPHVKLRNVKGEPLNQRIYFAFDNESGKIIVGFVGHLENTSTRYL